MIANAIWVVIAFLTHHLTHARWLPKGENLGQALLSFYHVNARLLYILGALLLLAAAVDLVLYFIDGEASSSLFVGIISILWTLILYGFLIGTIYNAVNGHPLLTPWFFSDHPLPRWL